MKRFKTAAQRATAFVLAASMSLSVLVPGAQAATSVENTPRIKSENSVDELGNIDLSDETYNVPEEGAETSAPEEPEEAIDEDIGADGDIIIAVPDQPEWLPDDMSYGSYDTAEMSARWHKHSFTDDPNSGNIKAWIEKPTCTKSGTALIKCNGCVYTEKHTVRAYGHSYGNWITTEATCTTAGRRYQKCSRCGAENVDASYAAEHPATGHDYGDWIIEDETCTKDAQKYRICQNTANGLACGDVEHDTEYEEAHKAHGHDLQYKDEWEYPCAGGTRTWYCANEDCDGIDIPAPDKLEPTADHVYGDWIVTKEPSCEGYGERQRTCTVCGTVDTDTTEGKEIQPIGHDWGDWVDDDKPACQQQTATRRCKREGCSGSEQKNLPNFGADGSPKPHKFTRWDTKIVWDGIVPKEITYASCDYCGYKEERENNASLTANTQAAKVAADNLKSTVRKIVDETLKDVQNNVNAAQTKEDATTAIANLEDSLAKAMAAKIYMNVGNTTVGITEEQAKKIVDEAMPELSGVKDSLDKSFLSKESIQAAVNKIVDSVTSPAGDAAIEDAAYELLYKLAYDALAGGKSDYAEPVEVLVGKLASIIAEDDAGWDALTEAIVDDAVALAMEELRNDEEYSRYLKTQLGADAIADVESMIKEQLVKDPAFMNEVRGYVQKAAGHAATGAAKGWSNEKILSNIRTDLSPVSSLVAKKISELGAGVGDIVDDKVDDTVHKFLPGKLGDWLSDKLGGLAQGKVNNAVDKAGTKVTNTIDSYLKYITCGSHDRRDRVIRNASCTETEVTENYCTKCGWVFSKEDSSSALGHDPVTVEGRDATETADGLTDGVRCARCGEWLEPQEVVPALEPQLDMWLVKAEISADAVKAAGYKNQKALDAAIDAAMTKAGFAPANSERFFAQVNSSIGILPNDRYPEEGVTGMVKIPTGAEGKNCTYYAVQVLTADTHGHNAGDVVVTPLTVTKEGISLNLYADAVVAVAWKVNE